MDKRSQILQFAEPYRNLAEVLKDHKLASLGDAYVNFVYSLALSIKRKQPSGAKVKSSVLADALRRAKLREYMPSGIDNHTLADAAEALLVYAWLQSHITIEESVEALARNADPVDGLTRLIEIIRRRIRLS